jgi:hypothetical protein
MYEARDALKGILGDQFFTKIINWQTLIRTVMRKDGLEVIPAVMKICQASDDPHERLMAIASAVEMLEPSYGRK